MGRGAVGQGGGRPSTTCRPCDVLQTCPQQALIVPVRLCRTQVRTRRCSPTRGTRSQSSIVSFRAPPSHSSSRFQYGWRESAGADCNRIGIGQARGVRRGYGRGGLAGGRRAGDAPEGRVRGSCSCPASALRFHPGSPPWWRMWQQGRVAASELGVAGGTSRADGGEVWS